MATHEDTINELSKQLDSLKSDTPSSHTSSSSSSSTPNTDADGGGIKGKVKALASKACTRPYIYYIITPLMVLTGLILAKPTFIMTQDRLEIPNHNHPFTRFPGPKSEYATAVIDHKPLCICKKSLFKWLFIITTVLYAIIFYNSQAGEPASCGTPTCKLF
jgi:hypothetical protein